jgi:hypothetical protein
MRRLRIAAALAVLASLAVLATVSLANPGGFGSSSGFDTAKAPYVTPAAPGVKVDAILSVGDTIGGYQMSGIPDGLGAYAAGRKKGTAVVVMNHELGRSFPNNPPGVDTRITRLEIDRRTHRVKKAEYLFRGNEGFERFCSATLSIINGRPFYFTGEEAVPIAGQPPGPAHDGSSIVMDPETGMWVETPHFGHLQHENVVPLKLKKWVFLTSEDDFRPGEPSYVYAWIGSSFNESIRGRNGSLYVWKADDPGETGNATVAKGESVPGHFVPISQAENANSTSLKAAALARNAFKFDRLEDIAARPDKAGRTYIADTGKLPATQRGRIYQFDVDRRNPLKATLKLILDGDAGDDIVNPDNMGASSKVLAIQEDRESVFRTSPNRVLVYDFKSKKIKTVAEVVVPPPLILGQNPNNAESSGIIDASHLLGRNWWLLDVQAHNKTESQPGPSLAPGSSTGEDGQLLAVYIPNSTSGDRDDD